MTVLLTASHLQVQLVLLQLGIHQGSIFPTKKILTLQLTCRSSTRSKKYPELQLWHLFSKKNAELLMTITPWKQSIIPPAFHIQIIEATPYQHSSEFTIGTDQYKRSDVTMGCTWPFAIAYITQNFCFSSLCFCHWQFVPHLSTLRPL